MKCLHVIILFYLPLILCVTEPNGRHDDDREQEKRGPMSFVVNRGCPYLTQ